MLRFQALTSRMALYAAATTFLLICGRASADEAVLLASTVPGYTPGMVIASSDRLSVPDGASATLILRSGEILRLGGPFEGTLDQSGSGVRATALANIFRTKGVDATVIGGTRAMAAARSASILDDVSVDPQHSGTYCITPSTSVWMTRPAADQRGLAIRREGSSRAVAWPSEVDRVEWPADVPVEDGGRYEIVTDGAARVTIMFRMMPSASSAGPSQVAKGIALGCQEQFAPELRRISRSVLRPELWMTTDRGRRPTYHQGDPILVTVMTNMDGYLYCIAATENGATTPIFPAGAVDGAQVRASMALAIPGRRQPAGLVAQHGVQQIRCWFADRDITTELPSLLLGKSATRIPDQIAADIDGVFARAAGTQVESGSLTVHTE